MYIIGLTGPMRAGKSTTAQILQRALTSHGVDSTIIPMAGALKRIATELGWNGLKDEKGRRLLQLLGTDVCRNCISQDYWVIKFLESAAKCNTSVIICDDIRFDDEAEVCDSVIRITGRDPWQWRLTENAKWLRKILCHKSEQGVTRCDYTINNSADTFLLATIVYNVVQELPCVS